MRELFESHLELNHYSETLQALLTIIAISTLRVYAAFMVLPATSDQVLQGRTSTGLCLVIGFFIAWGQPAHALAGLTIPMVVAMLSKEALLGVLLGFALSTVFWVAESAGTLVDNAAGFNSVQQTNPLSGQQNTPVANLMSQLTITGFYMLGGMLVCIGILFESFRWWPAAALVPPVGAALERFLAAQVEGYFAMAVKLAAPVLLIVVLIDLAFGLLGKAADKLEPQNLSQPVKSGVATALIALLVLAFFEQARPAISLQDMQAALQRWTQQLSADAKP
jgi:type III secretion protein T